MSLLTFSTTPVSLAPTGSPSKKSTSHHCHEPHCAHSTAAHTSSTSEPSSSSPSSSTSPSEDPYSTSTPSHPLGACQNAQVQNPRCWSCPLSPPTHKSLFCRACGSIQPPSKIDHFTLLGLPRSFAIDLPSLEAKFKQLQRQVHPDRFCLKSDQEQQYSSEQAAALNAAYSTLRDPLARGRYLLLLVAPELLAQGALKADEKQIAQVLDLRMDMEDASTVDELVDMYVENTKRMTKLVEPIADAFAKGSYIRAARRLDSMSYWCSIEEDLRQRIPGDQLEKVIDETSKSQRAAEARAYAKHPSTVTPHSHPTHQHQTTTTPTAEASQSTPTSSSSQTSSSSSSHPT